MSISVRPHRRQPTRLPRLWDSPGKNTGVGCHFLLQCMKVKSESEVAQSCPTLATPWTAAYQASPSMGFSRQAYWRGCQCRTCRFYSCIRKIPWRRKWQHTPVCLPGISHGQRNLTGYSLWGHRRAGNDLGTKQLYFKVRELG